MSPSRTRRSDTRGSNAARAAMQRRIILLTRLSYGPAARDELVRYVRDRLGHATYGTDPAQALRRDLAILTTEFDCSFEQDEDGRVRLDGLGLLSLLTLDDDEVRTFAALRRLFNAPAEAAGGPTMPFEQRVAALLDRLLLNLPPRLRRTITGARTTLKFVGPQASATRPEIAETVSRLDRYCQQTRISFEYRSLRTGDARAVRHTVDPYDLLFREGQFYLDAFMLRNDFDPRHARQWTEYRVDRIDPASIRSEQIPVPPERPPRPRRTVVYRLDPSVARQRDFTMHVNGSHSIATHDDGSATVTVETTDDLWLVRQQMLRYGRHCQVLAPAELVSDLRVHISALAKLYGAEEPQVGA